MRHLPIAVPQGYEGEGLRDYLAIPTAPAPVRWPWLFLILLVVFLLGFFSGTAYAAPAGEPCIRSFEVSPTVMLRLRTFDVIGTVRIARHPDHRAYTIAFTSDTGYAGSVGRELNTVEGELSPITQDPHLWRGLPGARYTFVLDVLGPGGKVLDRRTAEIRTPEDDR